MRLVRLGAAAFASTIALVGATGVLAGASARGAAGDTTPKLSPTATASEACELVFGTDAFKGAPSEDEVLAGDALSVNVTWGSGWKKDATVEVVGCTAVNGTFSEELSTRIRKVKNDGLFIHEFAVPKDLAKGAMVCERAIVIGLSSAGAPKAERLDAECFTVVAGARSAAAAPAAGKQQAAAPATPTPGPTSAAAPKPDTTAAAPGAPATAAVPAPGPARTPQQAAAPAVAGATETRPAAGQAAGGNLARTGSANRTLAFGAGFLLVLGGCAVAFGRPLRHALR